MQYRQFGTLDWKASALGFGCMRLPTVPGTLTGDIDEDAAIAMIRYAIDHGVNYFDTAYAYHDGKSEVLLGRALRDGYRERVRLATKSPVWMVRQAGDFDAYLDEQLARLQTDRVDFYLLHGLGKSRWQTVLDLNLLERAKGAMRDGRIGHLGFSFHDNLDVFKAIVDGYGGWAFCQIQYNYMDTGNQAGTEGLKYAASKGLAIVVMEPLVGGRLAVPPPAIQAIFDEFPDKRSPADWALQWVWSQPEVSVVLSGMSTMGQVEQNIRSANAAGPRPFSATELKIIERARSKYEERIAIPCTRCGYCMPCPNGVNIPANFDFYNYAIMYEDLGTARMRYTRFFPEKEHASACIQCRACEGHCPQGILISEWMPEVQAVLGDGKPPKSR